MTATPAVAPRLVTTPREGSVDIIADADALHRFVKQLDPALPVAVDAERAQSFRYSPKAYLLQFRQDGVGTHLLDPIALAGAAPLADLSELSAALTGCEWVVHAASQDLGCLAEVGLVPHAVFDTELAGRLLGLERVSLSPMLTHYLGIELAKAHSADDWSRRPLPPGWLAYAALDVDYLLELRDAVANDLEASGKTVWAQQEFDDVVTRFAMPPTHSDDRWRLAKGVKRLRRPRDLAVAQRLWEVRDDLARQLDIAPVRILSDANLAAAATNFGHMRRGEVAAAYGSQPGFTGRLARRQRARWLRAIDQALRDDPANWPHREGGRAIPPPRLWERDFPEAAKRWTAARAAVIEAAEANDVPVENLMTVATLGEAVWSDDADYSEAGLRVTLTRVHARPWQIDITAPVIAAALGN